MRITLGAHIDAFAQRGMRRFHSEPFRWELKAITGFTWSRQRGYIRERCRVLFRCRPCARSARRHVFTVEARKALAKNITLIKFPSHMLGLHLHAFPLTFARSDEEQAERALGGS